MVEGAEQPVSGHQSQTARMRLNRFWVPKHRRMPVLASWPFEVSWDIDDVKRTWAILNINNVRRSRDLRLNEESSDPSACY